MDNEIVKVKGTIKAMVHGLEDQSKSRIKAGQRIAAAFRLAHLSKIDAAETEQDREKLQKEFDSILEMLRGEYLRMTDGIADKANDIVLGNLPKPKQFKPSPIISSYGMLLNIDQYLRRMRDEELTTKQLELALREEPLYTEYLINVPGIGPKMAGVIISEFDFEKARYVSNMEAYAGLNTVIVGKYVKKGEQKFVSHIDVMDYFSINPEASEMVLDDGTVVELTSVAASKKSHALVKKEYRKKDGTVGEKVGIGFNPYLQAKMIAVLGPAFLKVNKTTLDGVTTTSRERQVTAEKLGFDASKIPAFKLKKAVGEFLQSKGHVVQVEPGEFGKFYYDYRHREMQAVRGTPDDMTDLHIHRRAIRYMIRMFFRELYMVGRHLNGLPIYPPYEAAKLGYQIHISDRIRETFGFTEASFVPHEPRMREYPKAIQNYLTNRARPLMAILPDMK